MFEKEVIAIDINREVTSILIGTKFKISDGITIETPKGAFDNGNIQDVQALSEVIGPKLRKAGTKDVSFIARGEDIITRHMNIPMASEEAMRDSVDFELRQFIGERLDEYYFDYQIINYNKNDKSGRCDVLIVAAPKKKIDDYMALAKVLRLNVKAIDLYANALGRVLANVKPSLVKGIKTIGVVNIDGNSSSLAILEWGKLVIEKYKDGGIYNLMDKESRNLIKYNELLQGIDLIEAKDIEEESDVERYLKSEISEYNSLIQYYTSGKVKKTLDRLYVLGTATKIKGLDQYLAVNLDTRFIKAPTFSDLKSSVKTSKKIELKDYIMPYGLLLRRE